MGLKRAYLSAIIIVVLVGSIGAYVYVVPFILHQTPSQGTATPPETIIHIPEYSYRIPSTWQNFTELSSPTFHFPVDVTVTIGVNNTIEWINDDTEAHTVTSFQVPSGAPTFNSDLIFPGKTFTATLTTPGVYKYFCAWHNWLAGVITVKPA